MEKSGQIIKEINGNDISRNIKSYSLDQFAAIQQMCRNVKILIEVNPSRKQSFQEEESDQQKESELEKQLKQLKQPLQESLLNQPKQLEHDNQSSQPKHAMLSNQSNNTYKDDFQNF